MTPLAEENETASAGPAKMFCLRLYITGSAPNSMRAVQNIKRICEQYLRGRYTLDVVDIYQQPALTKTEQIFAAPTLIRQLPLPSKRFVGDLSDENKVLLELAD